jgi:hypothetical protein
LKDWFTQPDAEFVTGPTIVRHKDKDIVAAATKDGRVFLLDAASLGGTNHTTPLHESKRFARPDATVSGDALAAWQQSTMSAASAAATSQPASPVAGEGTTWILVPIAGRLAAGSPSTNGAISGGGIVALKLVDAPGGLSLDPAWVSHDLVSPATPLIVNGVVFTLAKGTASTATQPGTPAMLHAYDGGTGKRLWNSEKSMATSASPGSLWSTLGQVYVGTHDGIIYAFGFNDERAK